MQQYFLVIGRHLEPLPPKPVLSDFSVLILINNCKQISRDTMHECVLVVWMLLPQSILCLLPYWTAAVMLQMRGHGKMTVSEQYISLEKHFQQYITPEKDFQVAFAGISEVLTTYFTNKANPTFSSDIGEYTKFLHLLRSFGKQQFHRYNPLSVHYSNPVFCRDHLCSNDRNL